MRQRPWECMGQACLDGCMSTGGAIRRMTEHEVQRTEGEGIRRMDDALGQQKFTVAMRLGAKPVLIQHTMVKTSADDCLLL